MKARLAKAQTGRTPQPKTLDLTLADTGSIEADSTYVGRIIAARYIREHDDRTAKFDVSIELLDLTGGYAEWLYLQQELSALEEQFDVSTGRPVTVESEVQSVEYGDTPALVGAALQPA
jgi:hypothetical protein